jgi:hypothetical protein
VLNGTPHLVEKVKERHYRPFRRSEKLFCRGVRERATVTKKVIFQRGGGFIYCHPFIWSRRSGDIFLPFIAEKTQRNGFSLTA